MGKGSTQNQKKIEKLRSLIAEKKELREIIKISFGESKNRLKKWLDENHNKLTQMELSYLGYTIEPEVVENVEVEKDTITKVPALPGDPNYISIAVKEMSNFERETFLKSDLMIQTLYDLVNRKITPQEEIKDTNLLIPVELKHLPDTMIKNIRVSDRYYKRFVQLAKENGVSIVDATNLMFKEFLAKYEK